MKKIKRDRRGRSREQDERGKSGTFAAPAGKMLGPTLGPSCLWTARIGSTGNALVYHFQRSRRWRDIDGIVIAMAPAVTGRHHMSYRSPCKPP